MVSSNYLKWLAKIIGYDFEVRYKLGLENKAVDALSRVPSLVVTELANLTFPRVLDVSQVEEEINGDCRLARIRDEIVKGSIDWPKYSIVQWHLLYQGQLVLLKGSSLIPSLLHDYHNSLVGGHSGFLRTYKRVVADVYWMGMKQDIKHLVEECSICQ